MRTNESMPKFNNCLLGACIEIKNNNYGSMLQSYATQVMLKQYGFNFELIKYKKKYTPELIIKSIPRLLNRVVWQDKLNEHTKKVFLKKHPELMDAVRKREKAFQTFRKDFFLAPIVEYYGYNTLQKQCKKYSAFLTGSDQLWSPSGLPTNFYNLMFTPDEAVRISFASSFGVKKIPWYQKNRTKHYLERIPFISCREESGKEIVKTLTGREVPVVADPTMMFDAEEWKSFLPCERKTEGKYIFSYMLGENPESRKHVLSLKEKTGLPIVSIHQYVDADLNFGDVSIDDAGPVEFVDLIRNAEYICTDSFHGTVFSIINHKKFVVFDRYSNTDSASKNTRIDSLCMRLNVADRRFNGDILSNMFNDINYESVDNILENIRVDSRSYLENAFSSINF